MPDDSALQTFRYRLNPEVLTGTTSYVLPFIWHEELTGFMTDLYGKRRRGIPYAQLNTALSALIPGQIHPFAKIAGQRRMVSLQPREQRPTASQIYPVIRVWATLMAQRALDDRQMNRPDLLQRLISRMDDLANGWDWEEYSLLDAWTEQGALRPMKFGLVPSYLASRAAGEFCQIGDHEIEWGLVQDPGRKLNLVSNIQTGRARDGSYGSFAFVVDMAIETQPGHRSPEDAWVAFFVHCRRFVDRPLESSDYQRLHSIMVQINQPRLTNWPASATWVSLPARLRSGNQADHADWAHGTSDLLKAFKPETLYPLPSVAEFVRNPLAFRQPAPGRPDICAGVYAEGLEPDHALEVGFSLLERYLVIKRDMERRYQNILIAGRPLPSVFTGVTLNRTCRPLMMLSSRDLAGHDSLRPQVQEPALPGKRVRQADLTALARAEELRLRRARLGQDLHFMLFRRQATASDWTQRVVRTMMHALYGKWPDDESGTWIEGISFSAHTLSAELEKALEAINPETGERERDREKREELLSVAWQDKRIMWDEFLANELKRVPAGRQALALIEMPPPPFSSENAPESIKGAVRAACIHHNVASQMLVSFGGKHQTIPQQYAVAGNAVREVLLRQVGINYGDIADLNARLDLGLPAEYAEKLTVVGVFRRRSNSGNVDYVLAVRITPSGVVEARIPGMKAWEPYLKVSLMVGKDFVRRKAKQSWDAELQFLQDILSEERKGPTVVMLVADQWRNSWPCMLNEKIEPNTFVLPTCKEVVAPEDVATPESQPLLSIVILRTRGNLGETPDYVVLPIGAPPDGNVDIRFVEESSLFLDIDAPDEFEIHLSVGRRPTTAKGLEPDLSKHEDGDVANRQQQMVEITPWFIQDGIKPVHLARLTHALRDVVPWWDGGSLTYPYPLQLARAVLQDMLCALGLEKSEEAEED
jgi:hypothetical protein